MRPPCRQGQACGDRRGPSPSSALTKLRLCRLVPSLPFAPDCTPPCLWLFVPLAKRTAVWLANKTIFRGRPDHDDQNENRPRRHLHTDYQRDGKGRRRRKRWQEPYSCACCLLNLVRRRRHASRKCLAGIVWTGRTNGWCDGPSSPEKGREWYLRNREKILARNKEKYRQETKKVEGTFLWKEPFSCAVRTKEGHARGHPLQRVAPFSFWTLFWIHHFCIQNSTCRNPFVHRGFE